MENGWRITFSDATFVELYSGVQGVTPRVSISSNNCWLVSYDCGETYSPLLKEDGTEVSAVGEDGLSVRVVVDADGAYVIETYNRKTNVVVERIKTEYSSNPSNIIQSIVENKSRQEIVLTMNSGESFVFQVASRLPNSISVLNSSEILLSPYEELTLVICVNPSDFYIDYNEIRLLCVEKGSQNDIYQQKEPEFFQIKQVIPAKDEKGADIQGMYVVCLKDNGKAVDYKNDVIFEIRAQNAEGGYSRVVSNLITITSNPVSSLPKVYITTPQNVGITSKVNWIEGCDMVIFNKDGKKDLEIKTSIRGRGNTTWHMPKKPYAIKLNSKAKVLGMPKHKRWVLLANWMDRTLLRNDVGLEIARRIMPWSSRGEFVELYLNGKHQGNYYLCEHIKVDKNRVNIDEIEGNESGDDLTGGYILEFDKHAITDEPNYFATKYRNLPVGIKEPDDDVIVSHTHPAFLYVQNYINSVEEAFEASDYDNAYNLIDLQSYVDWLFIVELALSRDHAHPKSCYMYKARNGKLYAGPMWDFDWGTFLPGVKWFATTNSLWYPYLFKDEQFKMAMKKRWPEIKNLLEGLPAYIDDRARYIRESNDVNIEMWPITQTTNGDTELSFDDAVARLKAAYLERVEAIEALVNKF